MSQHDSRHSVDAQVVDAHLVESQVVNPQDLAQSVAQDTIRAHDSVGDIVKASGSSFFWAMRLLPKPRRQAIFAVYAFCRVVDDIADGDAPKDEKYEGLQAWRTHIKQLYLTKPEFDNNSPDRSILLILSHAIKTYGLAQDDFVAVIDGMQMDVDGPIVAPSHNELLLYCDRVASAVGRLCVPIFGQSDDKGRAVADHLGLALQLTNIIRDVPEDAEIDRLYVPHEYLRDNAINTQDPRSVAAHPHLPSICKTMGDEAEQAFARARAAIALCDPKAMRAPVIMMQVYYLNLKRLRAAGWQPQALRKRNALQRAAQKIEKLCVALRYSLFS